MISSAVMAAVVVLIEALWFAGGMQPLYIAVGGFIYFLMLRLLNAVKEEGIRLFQSIIPKRFHRVARLFARIYGLETEKQKTTSFNNLLAKINKIISECESYGVSRTFLLS